jgi:hypothetical protein
MPDPIANPRPETSATWEGFALTTSLPLSQDVQLLQASLAGSSYDKRLLGSKTFMDALSALGVYPTVELNAENLGRVIQEINLISDAPGLRLALRIIAHNLVQLDNNQLPNSVANSYDDPIQTFKCALEQVTMMLSDEKQRDRLLDQMEAAIKEGSRALGWSTAVERAKAFQEFAVEGMTTAGTLTHTGVEASTVVLVKDADNRTALELKTFKVGDPKPLAECHSVLGREMPEVFPLLRSMIHVKLDTAAHDKTLKNVLLSDSFYPDSEILSKATVQEQLVVLPVDPAKHKTLFSVLLADLNGPVAVDLFTGEGCATSSTCLTSPENIPSGEFLEVNLPLKVKGAAKDFFVATASSELGEVRGKLVAQEGYDAATSVVILMRPVVESKYLEFLNKVVRFRKHEMTEKDLGEYIASKHAYVLSGTNCEETLGMMAKLVARGVLTEAQSKLITSAYQAKIEEGRAREARRLGADLLKSFGGDFGFDDRFAGGMARGGFGGPATKMSLGNLFTGSSGLGTGGVFGKTKKDWAVDPLGVPSAIVLRTVGVGPDANWLKPV